MHLREAYNYKKRVLPNILVKIWVSGERLNAKGQLFKWSLARVFSKHHFSRTI